MASSTGPPPPSGVPISIAISHSMPRRRKPELRNAALRWCRPARCISPAQGEGTFSRPCIAAVVAPTFQPIEGPSRGASRSRNAACTA